MDAAFFPHLRKLDFKQEGWRLEHENPTGKLTLTLRYLYYHTMRRGETDLPLSPIDNKSPIVFKGVVYNEMKGQMSDSSYLFYQRAQQKMFPGTTYENVSGGDPKNITDLTHEGLVQFQKTFYHPSNSHFYTYGNIPLEQHLEAIDAQIRNFDPIKVPHVNKLVTPWDSPKEIVLPCAADPCKYSKGKFEGISRNVYSILVALVGNSEKQTKLSLSFLTNDSTVR